MARKADVGKRTRRLADGTRPLGYLGGRLGYSETVVAQAAMPKPLP